METKKYHAFWQGAVILTIASLITKVLSAFYRIPYQNIVGDIGFYIYQQVYPFYGFCLILATYGFPIVISKMVAEHLENGNERGAKQVTAVSFWFLTIVGFLAFLVVFLGAHLIARIMGDEQLYKLLQVVAISFLLMPFSSVARGYFQGFGNMTPTAVSQVAEQAIRVSIIVLLSVVLVGKGSDMYTVGAGAMFGSVVGGIIGIFILLLFLQKHVHLSFLWKREYLLNKKEIIQIVFWQGITICVSNLVLVFLQLVDSISLYSLLVKAGEHVTEAKVIKGVYDRGIPLIQLGTVLATSFSLSLIPVITRARERGDTVFIQQKVKLAMKITFVIGIAAAVGLVCIIRPTNIMLFQNSNGSGTLAILAISILFSSFSITTASILQGLGNTIQPAIFVLIGAGVKYMGNIILIPMLGAKGAAVATIVSLVVIVLLNTKAVTRMIQYKILERKTTMRILVAALCMMLSLVIYTYIFEYFFPTVLLGHRALSALEALTAVAIGGSVYLILVMKLGVFTEEELGAVWKKKKESNIVNQTRKERGA
ncbi:oligosaccharide flippase family protein [Microbacteriaceae bacterium 4G12]